MSTLSRRDFLCVGGLTALGTGLTQLLHGRLLAGESSLTPVGQSASTSPAAAPRARSCILLWLDGGASHLDSFDPKPGAAAEIRGPFGAIPTRVPGIALSELLPATAQQLHRLTLIRSMTSPLGEHNFGTHYLLTGYRPTPALQYPAFGSLVTHVRAAGLADLELPSNIAIPDFHVGGGKMTSQGYLPSRTAAFEAGGDPAKQDFHVRDLDPFTGITDLRLQRRQRYLHRLDQLQAVLDSHGAPALGTAQQSLAFAQAFRLMTSPAARQAFDLEAESAETRQRYGLRSMGQSCLLARRLVERGVPFVTINNRGWDTHNDLVTRLKDGYTGARTPVGLIPALDLALTALVDDLEQRGLLDETLIVVMGEFGRTPKLNPQGGRDHWPRVFSTLLAGASIPGGQVIGASDSMGESPADRPITPEDLAASIYTLLGIDPALTLHTPDGRPVRANHGGTVIPELLG